MTTMLETLNETANSYTSKTRAVNSGHGCRYFVDGRCCAVGRCLENPVAFQNVHMGATLLDQQYNLESILKPEYRGFPINFWVALQKLHDTIINWDENGLSYAGKKEVDRIKEEFNL